MEAAEALERRPDVTVFIDSDPHTYLRGTAWLDPQDPIDNLLIGYKEAITAEYEESASGPSLPTVAQQRVLIAGLKSGNLSSARELVNSHMGVVAATAYPFKPGALSAEQLLAQGRHALLQSAKTYDAAGEVDFSDHAAAAIHTALGELLPDRAGDSFVELHERPMEGVYRFMEAVRPADTAFRVGIMKRRNRDRESKKLTPVQYQALPLLHLPLKKMRSELGENGVSLRRAKEVVADIKGKLGASTKEEAALIAFQKGIEYDVLDIPGKEHFSVDERLVAMRLWQPYESIIEELGFTDHKIRELRRSLEAKTGARSRAEIVLMAHMHDFEPTEEEVNPPVLPLLEQFTELEEKVLRRIVYLEDSELAEQPDIPLTARGVNSLLSNIARRAGMPNRNRTALLLELHRQGMEFDIVQLDEPPSNLLYAHELEVARRVHIPYEEINEELGWDLTVEQIGGLVAQAKAKTGARTRQELALVMEVYDDGSEALEKSPDNNRWRLAEYLGLKTLEGCDIEALLSVTTENEKEAITAYYLVDSPVTWPEISRQMGFKARNSAHSAAARGIARMRQKLESEMPELLPAAV